MRWIVRIFAALVACIAVAVGLLFLLPTDRIGQIASDQLERQTGRKLTLSGEFRPSLYPILGARTGAITVSNADWAGDTPMVSAKGATVGVDLMALLRGEVRIHTMHLDTPVIRLERAADGRTNWTFSPQGDAAAAANEDGGTQGSAPGLDRLSLEDGRISNGRIIYIDHAQGGSFDVDRLTGTVSVPSEEKGAKTSFTGRVNKNPVKVSLALTDRAAAIAGEPSDMALSVDVLDSSVGFDGTLGLLDGSPVLNGQITLGAANPAAIARRFGAVLPDPVEPLRDVRFDGTLNMAQALTLAGDITGSLRGTALSGRATVQAEPGWAATLSFVSDITLNAGDVASLSFGGNVSAGGADRLDGSLDVRIADIPGALAVVGQRLSPPKGALRTAAFSGPIRVSSDGAVTLGDGSFSVDDNRLNGTVRLTFGQKPFVVANLAAKALDVSALTGDSAGGGTDASGSASDGWSREPIAIEGLDVIDGDFDVRADSVNLGPTQLGRTDVSAKLRDGRMALTLRKVEAFGGTLSGTATVSGNKLVAFTTDLTARGVQIEPLLGQFAGITRLTGTGATKLKLRGDGASIHAMMNSLSGTGEVELGNGTIKGIDLGAMMQNLKAAFGGFNGATEFSSLTGTFRMDRGVLENVDLALITPLFRAGGRGSVDVGGRAMRYEVTPTRLAKGAEFSVPVLIEGPWSNLSFKPDLEGLVDLLANTKLTSPAEIEAAKKKVAEVKAMLDDPGATIEDKLKKELTRRLSEDLDLSKPDAPATDTASAAPAKKVPEAAKVEDVIKERVKRKLLQDLRIGTPEETPATPPDTPAEDAFETATDLALSTPGTRPRARPGSIRTTAAPAPAPARAPTANPAPAPAAQPEPEPDTRSAEEKLKDSVEDAAKKELQKLLGLGN